MAVQKKNCVVISPVGVEGTPQRNAADLFFDGIVRPALQAEFAIGRIHDVTPGVITPQIIDRIMSADLIVANLTDNDPSVHYALGLAHISARNVIAMIAEGQRTPFDNVIVPEIIFSVASSDVQEAAISALRAAAGELSYATPQDKGTVTPQMQIASSNGIELGRASSDWREDGYHFSAPVSANGALLDGARVHYFKTKEARWVLDIFRLSPAACEKIVGMSIRDFAGCVRIIEIEEGEVGGKGSATSLTTAMELPKAMPVGGDYVDYPLAQPGMMLSSNSFPVFARNFAMPPSESNQNAWTIIRSGVAAGDIPENRRVQQMLNVSGRVVFNREEWSQPWSIRAWRQALSQCAERYRDDDGDRRYGFQGDQFGGSIARSATLSDALLVHSEMRNLMSAATEKAREELDAARLIQYFDFPEATRPACAQYLAYFSQFLRDLGIESETEVKEEASRVLFMVTPEDGPSALLAVREALTAYLQLPALADAQRPTVGSNEIAVMQLEANVLHLRGQLLLVQATMQAQLTTIQAQQTTINAQAQAIDALRIAGAQVAKVKDSEPIIGTAVSVTKVAKFGVEIDLPQIVRSLKRRPPLLPSK